ncbi:MAG: lipoyl synthase [Planctomycetes bacterium]|nr:lipoyl synthase [Planctomycetota bacterium]MCB9888718.1 lipoyl synthase [Planctomycetota bacterium]
MATHDRITPTPKPAWLKVPVPQGAEVQRLRGILRGRGLHTVCEEARCPNLGECWAGGTATFMVLGDTCTRGCRFCSVKTRSQGQPVDADEPRKVAEAAGAMGLSYVVLTMVDRDDLEDGGAAHVAATVRAIKQQRPNMLVEALTGDFHGESAHLATVLAGGPDVFAHNLETVERLTPRVRDRRCSYAQSLQVLAEAKRLATVAGRPVVTKSSLMLGLGESEREVETAMDDLRQHGVDVLTLGQYLRPTTLHLPVREHLTPARFAAYEQRARRKGFLYVASGPLVRSSYKAAEFYIEGMLRRQELPAAETP